MMISRSIMMTTIASSHGSGSEDGVVTTAGPPESVKLAPEPRIGGSVVNWKVPGIVSGGVAGMENCAWKEPVASVWAVPMVTFPRETPTLESAG